MDADKHGFEKRNIRFDRYSHAERAVVNSVAADGSRR
jgi:hypothetical protein